MPLPAILPCWAVTAPGAELLAAAELRALGIEPGEGEPGGVPFEATAAQLADALLWLRTAVRVTVRLASFTAKSFAELERHGKGVDWASVIPPGTDLAEAMRVFQREQARTPPGSVLASPLGPSK